jgi:Vacuolar protein sorting-associated protein 35
VQIVIASFPAAYHVRTLQPLLATCMQLEPGVEVHEVMSLLMERLAEFARAADEPVFTDDVAFRGFLQAANGIGAKCAPRH